MTVNEFINLDFTVLSLAVLVVVNSDAGGGHLGADVHDWTVVVGNHRLIYTRQVGDCATDTLVPSVSANGQVAGGAGLIGIALDSLDIRGRQSVNHGGNRSGSKNSK